MNGLIGLVVVEERKDSRVDQKQMIIERDGEKDEDIKDYVDDSRGCLELGQVPIDEEQTNKETKNIQQNHLKMCYI